MSPAPSNWQVWWTGAMPWCTSPASSPKHRPSGRLHGSTSAARRICFEQAARGGLPKFIYISSLAAERGTSDYHASKREAEALVRRYEGEWVILRPGNVYGPCDDVISAVLRLHRALPVMLNRFEQLTGRKPLRIPIPEFLAGAGARLADLAGMPPPFNDSQIRMLIEENVVRDPEGNALTRVFNVTPTPLAEGLGVLADALMEMFRRRCTELMPIEFDGRFRPRRHDGRLAGDERRPGGGTEFDVAHRCATGGRRRPEARMRTWRQTRTC